MSEKKTSAWTWPMVALVALVVIVAGGTLVVLVVNP
jgi:hypothetical protein